MVVLERGVVSLLERSLRLVCMPDDSRRLVDGDYVKGGETVSFDLSGMDLEGKGGLTVNLLESGLGIEVKNAGNTAVSYDLQINAAGVSWTISVDTWTAP